MGWRQSAAHDPTNKQTNTQPNNRRCRRGVNREENWCEYERLRIVATAVSDRTLASIDAVWRSMLALASSWTWPGHTASTASGGGAALTLTYLEINGWLLTSCGTTILIDPVLEGNLDFGIPGIYDATKRDLPATGLVDTLPPLDALLITQGLDDHSHTRTLRALAKRVPDLPVFAPPSARPVIAPLFRNAKYITSNSRRLELPYLGLDGLPTIRLPAGSECDEVTIGGLSVRATSGALVGPPWQRRENGYVIKPREAGGAPSLYIEPHVEFDPEELGQLSGGVDVVVTPITGQGLPGFELVHGPSASADLVRRLRPRWVVPMCNGDVDASGASAPFIKQIGSREEFRSGLRLGASASGAGAGAPAVEVIDVRPGQPISLAL